MSDFVSTEMYTNVRMQTYNFTWEIRNVYDMQDNLKSPEFSPLPGEEIKWHCEFQRKWETKNMPVSQWFHETQLVLNFNPPWRGSVTPKIKSKVSLQSTSNVTWKPKDNCIKFGQGEDRMCGTPTIFLIRCARGRFPCERDAFPDGVMIVRCSFEISNIGVESMASNPLEMRLEVPSTLKSLYLSGCLSDVTFSVGGQVLRAHKSVVCSRSPVFMRMFGQEAPSVVEVPIADITPHTFHCFLIFLYSGELEDRSLDTILGLYTAAYRFEVVSLRAVAVQHMLRLMSVECVCRIYWFAHAHADMETLGAARTFMRDHFAQVVNQEEWKMLLVSIPQFATEIGSLFNSLKG